MRRLHVLSSTFLCALAGCSAGIQTAPVGTPVSTPTYPPEVTLADTIFLGDAITLDWAYPPNGTKFGIAKGEFRDFAGAYGSLCVSGCSPTGFQAITKAAPSFKRVVILIGTFDAMQTTACGGSGIDSGSVYGDYGAVVKTAEALGLQVFVGTIPPIDNGFAGAACTAAVAALNQEIEAMAQQTGAYLVDYNSALTSASDFTTSAPYAGVVPSVAGYAIMASTYAATTGGTP